MGRPSEQRIAIAFPVIVRGTDERGSPFTVTTKIRKPGIACNGPMPPIEERNGASEAAALNPGNTSGAFCRNNGSLIHATRLPPARSFRRQNPLRLVPLR